MLKYFVSYSYCSGNYQGFGNVELIMENGFQGIEDVKSWARQYEKEMNFNPNSLVVLNFQLF